MLPEFLVTLPQQIRKWVAPNTRAFIEDRQPYLWTLALVVGIAVSGAAIAFREMIGIVQLVWLADNSERIITAASNVPWYYIMLAPVGGGLIVGIMLEKLMPQRAHAVRCRRDRGARAVGPQAGDARWSVVRGDHGHFTRIRRQRRT